MKLKIKRRTIATLILVAILLVVLGIATYKIVSDIDRSNNEIFIKVTYNDDGTSNALITYDAHKKTKKSYKIVTNPDDIDSADGFISVKENSFEILVIDYNCYIIAKLEKNGAQPIVIVEPINCY